MAYKRILTIQDISCVGQCSMTVALPILSACGNETCILPTALLSTHTGGFGKPTVVHFDSELDALWRHWNENGITFDAILTGYLGTVEAVRTAGKIMDTLLAPDGITIVDPAMADHGKIYSGLTEEYVREMERLCHRADIILPNVTEAAIFSGISYQETLTEEYVAAMLTALNHPCIVLTGTGYREKETGVTIYEGTKQILHTHPKIGKGFHGTGDMFAAAFAGALMSGQPIADSVRIAADFVCRAIEITVKQPAHWYGVKFEQAIPDLIRMLKI